MHLGDFLGISIYLLLIAVIAVTFAKKIGLGVVFGLLVTGIVVGPHTFGPSITDNVESLRNFTELGVVLLLFIVGLEMRPSKLWSMKKEVFGLGGAQVILTGLVLSLYVYHISESIPIALLLGFTLSFSSTAIVIQMLHEKGELSSKHGQLAIAVLIFQDIAVIPLLMLLSIFFGADQTSESGILQKLAIISLAVGALLLFGKYVVPYLLEKFAREKNREGFAFIIIFSIFLACWGMEQVGVSMALGAFLLGMMLSVSRFHFQIEAHVEPFRGILMSLFFVSVGMSIDVDAIIKEPLVIAKYVAIIMLLKLVVLYFLVLAFGYAKDIASRVAFMLSQNGEFGFVILGSAKALGVIDDYVFVIGLSVISISMMLAPIFLKAGNKITSRQSITKEHDLKSLQEHKSEFPNVVIAGYGRVGQIVGTVLEKCGVSFYAFDKNLENVAKGKLQNRHVYYGDMSSYDFLKAIKIEKAKLVIVTVDDAISALKIVSHIKEYSPEIPIISRVKDMKARDVMLDYGVAYAIPESAEVSLMLGERALEHFEVAGDAIMDVLSYLREHDYKNLQEN